MSIDPIYLAKAILWEEAKGKLRAMVKLSGSGADRHPDFVEVGKRVEAFIEKFEDDAYDE